MEKISLLLDESTVEMLHLLARDSGKTIGTVVQEMALERYMNHALEAGRESVHTREALEPGHAASRPGQW